MTKLYEDIGLIDHQDVNLAIENVDVIGGIDFLLLRTYPTDPGDMKKLVRSVSNQGITDILN